MHVAGIPAFTGDKIARILPPSSFMVIFNFLTLDFSYFYE